MKTVITKYLIFGFAIILCSLGCKKNQGGNYSFDCDNTYRSHYLPDTLALWYNQIMDLNTSGRNFESKSSTGLSETIKVKRGTRWHQMNECGGNFYFNTNFDYVSSLYSNYFTILVSYKTDLYPLSFLWNLDAIKVDTNKFESIIHLNIPTGVDSRFNYLDLVQQVSPDYSMQMKVRYYTQDYKIIDSLKCDTCIQWKGIIKQGDNTYNNVYRYLNPLNDGIREFLIDKNYGVIQFTNKDKTVWTVSPF